MPAPHTSPPADPYDALGFLYDEWVVSVTEDIPFYCALARDLEVGTDAILELGSGSGRITMPLLLRGHRVIATDIATGQLERLRCSAEAAGVADRLEIVACDMRALDITGRADIGLAIAPFRSLLHVADDADEVFHRVAAAVRPGGRFAFDVFHPPGSGIDEMADSWQLRRRLELDGDSWSIWERAAQHADELVLDIRCDHRSASGDVTTGARTASMRLGTPPAARWNAAMMHAGFELEQLHGWFDGTPFDPGCADSVWVLHRP